MQCLPCPCSGARHNNHNFDNFKGCKSETRNVANIAKLIRIPNLNEELKSHHCGPLLSKQFFSIFLATSYLFLQILITLFLTKCSQPRSQNPRNGLWFQILGERMFSESPQNGSQDQPELKCSELSIIAVY